MEQLRKSPFKPDRIEDNPSLRHPPRRAENLHVRTFQFPQPLDFGGTGHWEILPCKATFQPVFRRFDAP
jgi:hypothetical protein